MMTREQCRTPVQPALPGNVFQATLGALGTYPLAKDQRKTSGENHHSTPGKPAGTAAHCFKIILAESGSDLLP